jgi:hypothetical protein
MKRSHIALAAAITTCGATAAPAHAANLCVGPHHGCFAGLAKAVEAAHAGDTVRIEPGVYRGGVTIGVSVELRGAGAGVTRIVGGGPVITIEPTAGSVAIRGVTISGGVTTSAEGRTDLAFGGGVSIAPAVRAPGAAVTIADSVIEHNVAAPTTTAPSDTALCPDGPCPRADGFGAGIYNGGSLTLLRTAVAHNQLGTRPGAAPVTSGAEGAGIYSLGPLTLIDSSVVDNESRVVPPNGRFANGGGIFSKQDAVVVRRTTIAGNRAILEAAWPASVELGNIGGGLFVDTRSTSTVDHSRIEDNELRATNSVGDAAAFSGGVHGNGPVAIRDSVVGSNHVTATVPRGSSATAAADSGAGNLNMASTITDSRLVDNEVTAIAGNGSAIAVAGALWAWSDDPIDVSDSAISGNRLTASGQGEVTASGGGLVNVDVLNLRATLVGQNTVRALGRAGTAAGGGIWNARMPDTQDLVPRLSLLDSLIFGNAVTAGPGIDVQGGGLFTSEPVTLRRTAFLGNRPDQCAGC